MHASPDDNPPGVDPDAPLDIVMFKGGDGDHAIHVNDNLWADMDETSQTLFSELMTGQITPDDLIEEMQAPADQIREDDPTPKITLEMPAR